MSSTDSKETFIQRLRRFSPRRMLLAAAGVVCVGLAALGVFLPGLPTTVFLIAATYLFTRSCPWMEERLVRNRFFAPFLRYMDRSAPMPWRAKLVAIVLMWFFVATSAWMLGTRLEEHVWIAFMPPAAALVGTWFIIRFGPRPAAAAEHQATGS